MLVNPDGVTHDLSDIINKIGEACDQMAIKTDEGVSVYMHLYRLYQVMKEYKDGRMDMVGVLRKGCHRDCKKEVDRLYGMLGMLRYDIPMDKSAKLGSINAKMVRHAFLNSDMSWMSIGGNKNKSGFIQPMYPKVTYVGECWRRGRPGIKISNHELRVEVSRLGEVVECESYNGNEAGLLSWICRTFKKWDINLTQALHAIIGHREVSLEHIKHLLKKLHPKIEMKEGTDMSFADKSKEFGVSMKAVRQVRSFYETATVVKASVNGKYIPLVINGEANVGDLVVLTKMTDMYDRVLGIVVSGSSRKGVCLYRKSLNSSYGEMVFAL
ncbi:hypothetical protein CPC16_004567 [Podila verticillata]|nr:hypothetical protein CPC16_004567 [Podila verticillata]